MPAQGHFTALTRLRGLAALCVVFGHAFHVTSLNPAQYIFNPMFLVISSGTILFVLIAGVLFAQKAVPRLMAGQTSTRAILRRRWAELSGTYLTVGLFLAIVVGVKEGLREGIPPLLHFGHLMLSGSMAHSYWYVPFFLLLMAMAPLHVRFAQLHIRWQLVLILIGTMVAAFVHRPNAQVTLGAVHALVYYLPVFWLGLLAGQHWTSLVAWLRGKELLMLGAVLALTGAQIAIGQDKVYLHPLGENWGAVDLFIPQKVAFALLFLSIFHRTQHVRMDLLDWVAKHSLTIFFMHSPVLIVMMGLPHVTGFYIPDLIAVTALLIGVGLLLQRSLVRVYRQLPERLQLLGDRLTLADARRSGKGTGQPATRAEPPVAVSQQVA